MGIHQISVNYQTDEDRLLMRVRTHAGELMELWFTRRMMVRLWKPLQRTADRVSLRGASPGATVMPEAQDMMTDAMREKSRKAADFASPFDESFTTRPLGERPLLVFAVDILETLPRAGTLLKFRDAAGREVSVEVTTELLLNLLSLLEQALLQSEWGLPVQSGSAADTAAPESAPSQRLLN